VSVRFLVASQPPLTDTVTAALIPVDRFSRLPVRRGVVATLWDVGRDQARPDRLVRNLSGHLVLLNQPRDVDYTFRVDAAAAGYRSPLDVTFNPSVEGIGLVVWLERSAGFGFESETTLVRGMVVRTAGDGRPGNPSPVADLTVSVVATQPGQPPPFLTTTDKRGVFALAVRLEFDPGAPGEPASTILRFEKAGVPVRALTRLLSHGQTHVFDEPIDLDGNNDPPFGP
jgi:hypothetical protein